MYQKKLKIRRKFLSHAINHVAGEKVVGGRVASDIYAKILGYDNNNTLNYLLTKNDHIAQMRVMNDWDFNNERAFEILSFYIPNFTQSMFFNIEQMSKPWYTGSYIDWRPQLISLLKGVENAEYLRYRNYYDLCDGLSYLFIYLADEIYNNKAKNRIYIICCVLSDLVETGRITSIRWTDIAALYREDNFNLLVDKFFLDRRKFIHDVELLGRIENYVFKDSSLFSTHSIAATPFQNLFRELGVDVGNLSLSVDLERNLQLY